MNKRINLPCLWIWMQMDFPDLLFLFPILALAELHRKGHISEQAWKPVDLLEKDVDIFHWACRTIRSKSFHVRCVSFSGVWYHQLKTLLPWLNLVLLVSLKVDLFTKLHLRSVYFSKRFSWAPQQTEQSKQFQVWCIWSECWNKKIWGESWWCFGWGGARGSGWCVTHGGGCAHCLCASFVRFDIHKKECGDEETEEVLNYCCVLISPRAL